MCCKKRPKSQSKGVDERGIKLESKRIHCVKDKLKRVNDWGYMYGLYLYQMIVRLLEPVSCLSFLDAGTKACLLVFLGRLHVQQITLRHINTFR